MGVGSFTAMNLTGGNPITAVGLDNYTTKIGPYFRTPDSLKDKVEKGEHWDVPARGEKVEVADDVAATVRDALMAPTWPARLSTPADLGRGLQHGLDVGLNEARVLVHERSRHRQGAGAGAGACRRLRGLPGAEVHRGARQGRYTVRHPGDPARDRDGVAVLTIRRPKVLNALDQDVFRELQRRFEECDATLGQGRRADRLR